MAHIQQRSKNKKRKEEENGSSEIAKTLSNPEKMAPTTHNKQD